MANFDSGVVTDRVPDPTPLEMAVNAATAVLRYADAQTADPVTSHIHNFGQRGHQSAELAGHMALVSIAQDLHRLTERLLEEDATPVEQPAQ